MSIVGRIEIRKGAKGAKRNGGAKMTLPEVTEEMKIKYADAVKANTPRNGVSKREYTGENVYRLVAAQLAKGYTDSRWYTFNQLQDIGARIKKGEHGTKIMRWWSNAADDAEAMAAGLTEEEVKATRRVKPKIYVLFNAEQCTGITTAPEAVTTVEETEGKKYKNVIKGSFEIKPKEKKTKKTEVKAPETKKPEEVTEEKAAPVATAETQARLIFYKAALDALGRMEKAAEKWNGKVYDARFVEAMAVAAAAGGVYFKSGTGIWAKSGTGRQAYAAKSNTVYRKTVPGFYVELTLTGENKKHSLISLYDAKLFATIEEGKKPRIDAEKLIKALQEREREFFGYIERTENTIDAEEAIKNAVAEIERLKKFLNDYDVATIGSQGYAETSGWRLSI